MSALMRLVPAVADGVPAGQESGITTSSLMADAKSPVQTLVSEETMHR
jgi:hypothetical protein